MKMLCIELHQTRLRNVESVCTALFSVIKYEYSMTKSIFLKFAIAGYILVRISYTEFHESPTNTLVIDTKSQECGWKWSSLKVSLFTS
jgi:hypothetical protein